MLFFVISILHQDTKISRHKKYLKMNAKVEKTTKLRTWLNKCVEQCYFLNISKRKLKPRAKLLSDHGLAGSPLVSNTVIMDINTTEPEVTN